MPIIRERLLPGVKLPLHRCGIKGKFGSIPECLLSSKAAVQIADKSTKRQAANGHNRTFGIPLVTNISQIRILPNKGHNLKLAAPTIVVFSFFVPQLSRILRGNDME